ncbi:hypothetical protein GGI43DRAFT_393537 [Trichoderma evansii]
MQNEKVNKGKREEAKRKHHDYGSGSQAPVCSGCAPALHEHRPRKKKRMDQQTKEDEKEMEHALLLWRQ